MSDAVTREETLLNAIATGEAVDIVPVTRKEKYLRYLAGIGEKPIKPITREEMFLDKIQAGGGGGEEEASLLDSLIDRTITEISSDATSIGKSVFNNCITLTTVNFPLATRIDDSAFSNCSALTTVDFPLVERIGSSVFYNCKELTTVKFPVATYIDGSAFSNCSALTTADFPLVTTIRSAFANCSSLTRLILRSERKPTLSSALNNTPIASGTGYIYVPSALVDSYKSATNWSTYADQFRALEDYTVDGTITGELDESKI